MERLSPATAARLPAGVRRPGYDRSRLRTGILHLGLGAFHRCHQADFAEDLAEAGHTQWGIEGINLRSPRISDALGPQEGLYVRRLTASGSVESRLIGCIRTARDAEDDWQAALSALARPQVHVATLTVTEKGYCHVPATGTLDRARADVLADLSGKAPPSTAPGFLVDALARRRGRGDPLNHCALNVAVYGDGSKHWAMTERGRSAIGRTPTEFVIGPSSVDWNGEALTFRIDAITNPIPSRLQGIVRVYPSALTDESFTLDPAGRHRWRPIAPCSRVQVDLRQPAMRWLGDGYFDINHGDAPLEADFAGW
ncbi:hypothetical protein WDZ92_41065, partial [Nostoc sp. NIES-2111]